MVLWPPIKLRIPIKNQPILQPFLKRHEPILHNAVDYNLILKEINQQILHFSIRQFQRFKKTPWKNI